MCFSVNGHRGVLYKLYIRIELVNKGHFWYKNIHQNVLYYTNIILMCYLQRTYIYTLADPGGAADPPMGSNSFIFTCIFAKKRPRWRSASPPMARRPPTGNPGSATATFTKIRLVEVNLC